jgi:DNA-directed RNA polymerase specialized sigma24 family protein
MNPEPKITRNYVDNAKLYESFVAWYESKKTAEAEGRPEPEPPLYIAECIVLIPTRLASKGNFSGYSFKDDMIGDAIENIVQYYRNFDIQKSKNPFAYFTQIAYFAFLRRIIREKRQSYIKHKLIQNSDLLDSIITQDHDDSSDYHVSIVETMKMNLKPELEAYFEGKKGPKKLRKTAKSIEDLLEEDLTKDLVEEERLNEILDGGIVDEHADK